MLSEEIINQLQTQGKEIFDFVGGEEIIDVVARENSFQFRIKNTTKKLGALFKIKKGVIEKLYKLKEKHRHYKILEGENTLKIVPNEKVTLKINGKEYQKGAIYLSKNTNYEVQASKAKQ